MAHKLPVVAIIDIGLTQYKLICATWDTNHSLVLLDTVVDFFDGISADDSDGPHRLATACMNTIHELEITHKIQIHHLLVAPPNAFTSVQGHEAIISQSDQIHSVEDLNAFVQTECGKRVDDHEHVFDFECITGLPVSNDSDDEKQSPIQGPIEYISFTQDGAAFKYCQALLEARSWASASVDMSNRYLNQLLDPRETRPDNCVCIDTGRRQSYLSFYKNNQLIAVESLPIGGDHITNDISICMETDKSNAEQLKRYGLSLTQENPERIKRKLKLVMDQGIPEDVILLQNVAKARIDEWASCVNEMIRKRGFNASQHPIYLFGKGLKINGLCEYLAQQNMAISFPKYISPDRIFRRDNFLNAYALLMSKSDYFGQYKINISKNKKGILGKIWSVLSD